MTIVAPLVWGLPEDLYDVLAGHTDSLPKLSAIAVPAAETFLCPPLPEPLEKYTLSKGVAAIYQAKDLPPALLALTGLAQQMCDHRYYGVVQKTLSHEFPLLYLVLHDRAGAFRGAQPFFVVEQNILAGVQGKIADLAEKVRTKYPRFLTLKTLMLGNPAGPGALGIARDAANADPQWFTTALGEALDAYSRCHKVRIVVFKDFPAQFRSAMSGLSDSAMADGADFLRIPSMPMTGISLTPYSSFEDYMARTLSKATRKNLRRKFKATANEKIEMTVTNDIAGCIDEVYRLYLQVYNRATMKFEKLTPAFFLELSRRMPDRVRFFLWRRAGKLIAVSITLVKFGGIRCGGAQNGANGKTQTENENSLIDLYLGMEYPLALDLHMYFVTMRDIIQWCIDHQIDMYYSTPLNYDAKLHFRHKLVPQDLYVRHTSPILNPLFKFAMRFAEPTRHDKIIRQFANAHEL